MNLTAIVTRWWWVRHAPLTLPTGTIAGQMDANADLSGTETISAARCRLPGNAVWLVTPLSRSRDSADALIPDSPPQVEPDLIEQDFGQWQGRTHGDLWNEHPDRAAQFWTDPAGNTPPGGESFKDLYRRVAVGINRWNKAAPGRDIIMVGHAGPIRAAMALALGVDPASIISVSVDHWHLFRMDHVAIEGHSGQWRLIGANIPP